MREAERAQVAAAAETMGRVRKIRVKFMVSWTRLDDLEPEAERNLRARLQAAWDTWTEKYGVTDSDVKGPDVITHKLDYFPTRDGEFPGKLQKTEQIC